MYSDSGKIYCLANIEHLRYDVCEMAEKHLTFHVENTMKKGNIKFNTSIVFANLQQLNA